MIKGMHGIKDLLKFPKPTEARKDFIDLTDNRWEISFNGKEFYPVNVPYPPESHLSGIGEPPTWEKFYYRTEFDIPVGAIGKRVFLNFMSVDHYAKVFVNNKFAGSHWGGFTPFSLEITDLVVEGKNSLFIEVYDYDHLDILRGKQSWKGRNFECWYQRTSGITGPVWIELTEGARLRGFRIFPADKYIVILFDGEDPALEGEIEIEELGKFSFKSGTPTVVPSEKMEKWSPLSPRLYPAVIHYGKDEVLTYVFSREVGIKGAYENGKIMLNGEEFIFKGALDQRLYPKGLSTPEKPYVEAFKEDLNLVKSFGLNALRVHGRIENPKFYTLADIMGIVLWQDFPPGYMPTDKLWKSIFKEGFEIVSSLFNHPSIIAWTIFNESWGLDDMEKNRFTLPQDTQNVEHLLSAYSAFKRFDPTRLIVDNSGWEHVETDIFDWHSYLQKGEDLKEHGLKILDFSKKGKVVSYHPIEEKPVMWAYGRWKGSPFILSEFGGVGFAPREPEGLWAYSEVRDERSYLSKLEELFEAAHKISPAGFVYTQLYDVFQEKNGLAYADRTLKLEAEKVAKVVSKFYK